MGQGLRSRAAVRGSALPQKAERLLDLAEVPYLARLAPCTIAEASIGRGRRGAKQSNSVDCVFGTAPAMSVWDRDDLVAIAAGGIAGIDAIPRGDTASFHSLLAGARSRHRGAASLYITINERIKLRFRVTVALIIAGGHQSTIRPHLRRFRTLSRSPRKLCLSPTFIRVKKRSNLETCIAATYTKYF